MAPNSKLDYIVRDEFHFDVLKAVTEPMDNLDTFKHNILECFLKNLSTSRFEFSSYQPSQRNNSKIEMCDTVALNVEQPFYGEAWLDEFFDSCIYNPNRNPLFLNSDRSVFKISDFMSYQTYEQNKNFKELIEPHGYYYSAVAFLKHRNTFVGQITLLRAKEEGDFSQEEIAAIEGVAPLLRNRLLDYNALNSATVYKDVFFDILCENSQAVMLLDRNLRVLASNDKADELCGNIIAQQGLTGEYIQMVVDKVFCCGVANRSHFNIVARDGKTYYFSLKPYRVTGADRYSTVYIVYISREGYVGGAEREGLKSDSRLTNRQIEIVNLIAAGLTNSEIASHLHISEHTVRKHIENIRVQLGVGNRIAKLNELDLL